MRFKKTGNYLLTGTAALAAISLILQVFHMGILSNWGMWIDLVAVPWMIGFFLFGIESAFMISLIMLILISLVAPTSVIGGLMKWLATAPMFFIPAMLLIKGKKTSLVVSAVFLLLTASIILTFTHSVMNPYNTESLEKSKTQCFFKGQETTLDLRGQPEGLGKLLYGKGEAMDYAGRWKSLKTALEVLIPLLLLFGAILLLHKKYGTENVYTLKNPIILYTAIILAVLVRGIVTCIVNYYFAIPVFFSISTECALNIPWQIIFGMNLVQGVIDFGLAWIIVFKSGLGERFGV